VALVAATGLGAGWALARQGAGHADQPSAGGGSVRVQTARVVRTDVIARFQTNGVLGFAGSYAVVDQRPGGTITRLPSPGQVVRRGQVLFETDGRPVILFYGARPAWRPFVLGMADGADVEALERNLVALGYARGLDLTVDGHFTAITRVAILRWQAAVGIPRTGAIDVGDVAFLPGPIRVTTVPATLGGAAAPGDPVVTGTSTDHVVSVELPVGGPTPTRRGDRVIVTMPDGTTTTAGTVVDVGRVATAPAADLGPGQGPPPGPATIPITIRLHHPRVAAGLDQAPVGVAISEEQHRGVLAVPVTALVPQPGGGYAVEVVAAGRHLRTMVTIGLFDDALGLVEVSGPGLAAGMTVEVAAG
jgi:hypothetical protein